jgi:hypothetical protein
LQEGAEEVLVENLWRKAERKKGIGERLVAGWEGNEQDE